MSTLVITIHMDKMDKPQEEVKEILSRVSVKKPAHQTTLRDSNGDYVGSYSIMGGER